MGVTAYEFCGYSVYHFSNGEITSLFCDLRMENDLQQHIAQLFANMRLVARLHSLNDLGGFFQQVLEQ